MKTLRKGWGLTRSRKGLTRSRKENNDLQKKKKKIISSGRITPVDQ